MAKYDGLGALLNRQTRPEVTLTFAQIAEVVAGLPPSAYQHRAWWSNERNGRHVHAAAWMSSGWRVAQVDLDRCNVTFTQKTATAGDAHSASTMRP